MADVPTYQKAVKIIAFAAVGVVGAGTLLDAFSNALSLVAPPLTYLGSAAIAGVWLIASVILRLHPLRWVIQGGKEIYLKKIGIGLNVALIGIVGLLWVPRLVDYFSEKKAPSQIYRVRVTVVDPTDRPVSGAEITSLPNGEQKTTESGSEIVIPDSIVSQDRKVRFWAVKDNGILRGNSELILADDHFPTVIISLQPDRSARIKGEVKDEAGDPVHGVSVYIQNYQHEKATTDLRGRFDLAAHAAANEHVRIFVEADGYEHWNDFIPAGGESVATITIVRKG